MFGHLVRPFGESDGVRPRRHARNVRSRANKEYGVKAPNSWKTRALSPALHGLQSI